MAETSDGPRPWNTALAALGGVVVGALGLATAVATGWFTYAGKDQELRVHLVEIAVSILRADPKEDVGAAREWAIDIMERNSGVNFSGEDRAALLHKPLQTVTPSPSAFLSSGDAFLTDSEKAERIYKQMEADEPKQKAEREKIEKDLHDEIMKATQDPIPSERKQRPGPPSSTDQYIRP
jgi:hypothetical protein